MNTLVALPAAAALLAGLALVPVADATDIGLVAPAGIVRAEGHGFSYNFGSKHAVGYYERQNDTCAVTLMLSERFDPEYDAPTTGARIRVSVAGGDYATVESGEGPAIQVSCAKDASHLKLMPIGGGAI